MAASSLVTFVQNLGCTISLPDVHLPSQVKDIMNIATRFLAFLEEFSADVPKFDVRTQLVLTGLIIPLFLDIIVSWLFYNTLQLILHVADVLILTLFAVFTTQGILGGTFGIEFSIIAGVAGIYFIGRLIYIMVKRHKKAARNIEFFNLAGDVCDFHLADIIPSAEEPEKVTREELTAEIAGYSDVIAVSNDTLQVGKLIGRLILVILFAYISLACSGFFPSPFELPSFLVLFFPYFGYPLAVVIALMALLGCCEGGRHVTLKFNQVLRRWGLRILMFLLSCLYIPILSSLVSILLPTSTSICPAGEFPLYVNRTDISQLRPFIIRETVCSACRGNWPSPGLGDFCPDLCSGEKSLRLIEDIHLAMWADIVKPCLGLAIFVVIAILIGIPGFLS
jgi:hypothetical protein